MTEKKSSYTIRLKIEGDGTVTANLVKVGDAGERQFKRLQNAGNQADMVMQGISRTITRRLMADFMNWFPPYAENMACPKFRPGRPAAAIRFYLRAALV